MCCLNLIMKEINANELYQSRIHNVIQDFLVKKGKVKSMSLNDKRKPQLIYYAMLIYTRAL